MPALKEVPKLYGQCLDIVFEDIFDFLNFDRTPAELEEVTAFYRDAIPAAIRQNIINVAVLKDRNRILHTLEIIRLLIDSGVRYIRPTLDTGFLLAEHYETLTNILRQNNCVGLNTIFIKVILDRTNEASLEIVQKSNAQICYLLANGLGSNLCVLNLEGICNNDVLCAVGKHCTQLQKLNVSSSWGVTDRGIDQLLLEDCKKPNESMKEYITRLIKIDDSRLNRCCFTMTDIRIQDTDTSASAVVILLILVKKLITLGGFIYFRSFPNISCTIHTVGLGCAFGPNLISEIGPTKKNVGDALMTLSTFWKNRGKHLKLQALWDTHLPETKIKAISPLIPDLNSLYTRAMYLTPAPTPFRCLHTIKVDFDYKSYENMFLSFLEQNGKNLKNISLLDQLDVIDLAAVANFCPRLEQMRGLVTIENHHENVEMRNLKKARLRIRSAEPLSWLFKNAPKLELLEVLVYYQRWHNHTEFNEIDNRFFKTMIALKPSCFQTLRYFNMNVTDMCTVSKKTVKKFIEECPKLQIFGDFNTLHLPEKAFHNVLVTIKRCNYAISLRKRGNDYPSTEMNPFEMDWSRSYDM